MNILPPVDSSVMDIVEDMGLELDPQQVAMLKDWYGEPLSEWEKGVADEVRETIEGRPQLTARAERYIGLMAHIALYGSEDGTEIQGEGLEDRISTFHEYVRKLYDQAQVTIG